MASRPSTGSLTDWLRDEARQPFSASRDDRQDQVALQWLLTEVQQNADPRLLAAVEELLAEGDPVVSTRLLEIAIVAPAAYRSAVARALAANPSAFAAPSESMRRTLRGQAIGSLVGGNFAEPLPRALADVLYAATTEADGWPTSVMIGLLVAPARFFAPLVQTAQKADTTQLAEITRSLVNAQEPRVVELALGEIGTGADLATRQRVLTALEQALIEREEAAAFLASRGLSQKPGPTKADLAHFRSLLQA